MLTVHLEDWNAIRNHLLSTSAFFLTSSQYIEISLDRCQHLTAYKLAKSILRTLIETASIDSDQRYMVRISSYKIGMSVEGALCTHAFNENISRRGIKFVTSA
jgi:hypothetical protein